MKESELLSKPEKLYTIPESDAKDIVHRAIKMLEKRNEPVLLRINNSQKVFFVGDIHGDFIVMQSVVKRFLESKNSTILFLGDLVDRAPQDCQFGSVHSMLLALTLKLKFPDKVFILMGNHEGNHLIPCYPYELHFETEARFGGTSIHELFVEFFKMLPLMAQTSNGIFCAHAGIPRMKDWMQRGRNDADMAAYITWGDPLGYGIDRGFGDKLNFSSEELKDFLDSVGANVFVRGHDYTTLGTSIFNNKSVTIFTSRRYQDYGNRGVLLASALLNKEVKNTKDFVIEQFINGKWVDYEIAEID